MSLRYRRYLLFAFLFTAGLSAFAEDKTKDSGNIPPGAPISPPASAQAAIDHPNTALQENPVPTAAVAAPPSGPTVTLEECVARALDKNFDLRIQRFGPETAKEDVTIAKAAFDPALQLTSSRFHQRAPLGSAYLDPNGNIVVGAPYSSDGDTTRAGVTQALVTGTTISASADLGRSDSVPPSTLFNPVYNSDVSLTVKQPLLRNFGTRVNRAVLDRAKLGVHLANLDFKSAILTVVRNVESAYYNLAFSREQKTVRAFSLDVAKALLEENKVRQQTGVVTDLEVLQAQVQVANAQRSLLLADKDVHDKEDALLALIEPFGFARTPIGNLRLPSDDIPALNGDLSYKRARENTPEYASSQTLIAQLRIDADVARINRLPELDVSGTGGYTSDRNSYGSAASHALDGDGYNWELDATLSFPWGLRADRARYRQSQIALHREEMHLRQLDQNILVNVRSAVRAVQTNEEGVRISALSTELSRREYDVEKARYEEGLSTFRLVEDAKADWDTASINELQAKVDLRNALADLSRLEGSSIERYRIKIEP